ncbi:MAG: hypothetical protein WC763_05020, partial [Candidatus Paceibacterota bacterium]
MKLCTIKLRTFSLTLLIAVALLAAQAPSVFAARGVPLAVSYQGHLTDSGGNALGGTGTPYYFRFSLWDSATIGSGSKVWPSSAPGTVPLTVRQGSFSVDIGDTDAGYPDALDYDFSANGSVYLQVEVSGDGSAFETLSPRSPVTASPFALVAAAVSGAGQSSFGTTTPFAGSVVTSQSTSSNSVALSLFGASGQTANLFNIFNSSGSTLFSVSPSGGVYAAGNVGIGTSSPQANLAIQAVGGQTQSLFTIASSTGVPLVRVDAVDGTWHWGNDIVKIVNPAGNGYLSVGGQGVLSSSFFSTNAAVNVSAGSNQNLTLSGGQIVMRANNATVAAQIAVDGRFAVGTSTPFARLSVQAPFGSSTPLFDIATTTSAAFATSSVFRIGTDGRVGIGSSTPYATLGIVNSGLNNVALAINNVFTVDGAGRFYIGELANKYSTLDAGLAVTARTGNDIPGIVVRSNVAQNGSANALQSWQANNGTALMTFTNSGNLGVGSSTPNSRLSVTGGGTGTGSAFAVTGSTHAGKFEVLDNGAVYVARGGGAGGLVNLGDYASILGGINYIQTQGILPTSDNAFDLGSSAGFRWKSIQAGTGTSTFAGAIGIGTTTPASKLQVLGTTEQFRIGYDKDNYSKFTVASNGATSVDVVGTSQYFHFADQITTLGVVANNASLLNTNLDFASGGATRWTSQFYNSTADTSISRNAAGVLQVGSGASNNANGKLLLANIGLGTSSPSAPIHVWTGGAVGIQLSRSSSPTGGTVAFTDQGNTIKARMGIEGSANNFFVDDGTTARLTILNSNGNVGIGTTNPGAPLDFAASVGQKILFYNGLNYGIGMQSGVLQVAAHSSANSLQLGYGASASFTPVLTSTGGNIGIGTTSPASKLHVYGAATTSIDWQLMLNNPDSGTVGAGTGIRFQNTNIGANTTYSPLKWSGIAGVSSSANANSTDIAFYTETSASTPNEKMRLTGAGNLGIGTLSPQTKLQVFGTGEAIRVGNSTNASSSIGFSDNGGSPRFQIGYDSTNNRNVIGDGLKDLHIKTSSVYNTSGADFAFTSSGRFGIGTTTPTGLFEIQNNTADTEIVRFSRETSNAALRILNYNGSNGTFRLQGSSNVSGGIWNEALSIGVAGNIGIGTASPTGKLTISGSSGANNLDFLNGSDVHPLLQLLPYGHDNVNINLDSYFTSGWKGSTAGTEYQINKSSNKLNFNYGTSASAGGSINGTGAWSTAMTISAGNVGIGTSTPAAKLDVYGTSRISNTATVYTDITGTGINAVNPSGQAFYITTGNLVSGFVNNAFGAGTYATLSLSGTSRIPGIQSNSSLHFFTNNTNTPRISIDTAGNVGIGTASPVAKLEVAGNIMTSGVTGNGTGLFARDAVSNSMFALTRQSNQLMIQGFDGIGLYAGTTASPGVASAMLTVKTDGNVGIGTTTPGSLLTLGGSGIIGGVNGQTITMSGSGGTTFYTGGDFNVQTGVNTSRLYVSAANGGTTLGTYAGSVGPTNGLAVSGSVGIGTLSPQTKLQVFGTGEAIRVGNSTNASSSIGFSDNGGSPRFQIGYDSTNNRNVIGDGLKDLHIKTSSVYNTSGADFAFTSSGRFGIGTTTPTGLFEIQNNTADTEIVRFSRETSNAA